MRTDAPLPGPSIKHAVLSYLDKMLDCGKFNSRHNFLNTLQRLFKAKDFPQGNERLPYTFPWPTPTEFIQEAIVRMLKTIVRVAIRDEDSTIYGSAQELLTLVARDGESFRPQMVDQPTKIIGPPPFRPILQLAA